MAADVWAPAPLDLPSIEGELHVWRVALDVPEPECERLRELLSPPEAERAARLRLPRDRRRFVVAHAALRTIVARYVGTSPELVPLATPAGSKPALVGGAAGRVEISLTHSGELAMCAVARGHRVGVDVEHRGRERDYDAIARRFFAPAETRAYGELPEADRPAAFLVAWTRKEAYVKAVGTGIVDGVDHVIVPVAPGDPARLIAVHGDVAEAARWTVHDLAPAADYAGAVAVDGHGLLLRLFAWGATS